VKGKGQLMTYYLIGKNGSSPSNPKATFNAEEENKSNPDSNPGINEDFKINLEIHEDFSNNSGKNNTTECNVTGKSFGGNLNSTQDSEGQNVGHTVGLPDESKYQLSNEDTSLLLLSSTAVNSGSSKTHLLEKSDADD
jgi:muramoyltetrapeptide carboxypeptidase LdcA involved in peptidoglycan recycling